jgi:hypothetical protein
MHHLSVEWISVPIVGTDGWATGTPAVELSVDQGLTWQPAEVLDMAGAVLPSGVTGQRATARVLSSAFGQLQPGRLDVLARITHLPEKPVLRAGSLPIT